MIHKHIKSLPHHPKRVIIISLVVALSVGIFGYVKINKKVASPVIENDITSAGNMPASNHLTLGFLAAGRIKSVSVKAGDKVVKGQVLAALDAENAQGALLQAKAAYQTAESNYQKIINGATGPSIDVAKAAVHTAQVNFDGVTKQQNILVANAYSNLLNSSLIAKSSISNSLVPPTLSGVYGKDTQGTIKITFGLGGGASESKDFVVSGVLNGIGTANTNTPEPVLDTGIFIQLPKFANIESYSSTIWSIDVPNTTAPNYLANYNAYQTALQTKTQMIANAQAVLDQANASLSALVAAARPEDVAAAQAQVNNAQGAVQIAQAAVQNTIITAPADGTVTSVAITPGQIATPNAPAIEFTSN
ncbi:biotin/lipoyl-binding protein [Candidatus Nomurabacteria bacterium]|nr:biotin/lipoyl-binding protein [Candidatus Nomurabacteria bacterium]